MADPRTRAVKDELWGGDSYRLGALEFDAVERGRTIKRCQKERGVRFSDPIEMIRADCEGEHDVETQTQ